MSEVPLYQAKPSRGWSASSSSGVGRTTLNAKSSTSALSFLLIKKRCGNFRLLFLSF